MRLMITGRHVAVTPALREYVETRMERLDRYGLKLGTLQILLSLEKFHHVAEVVGVVQGGAFKRRRRPKKCMPQLMRSWISSGRNCETKERKTNHKFGDQPRVRALVRKGLSPDQSEVEVVHPTLEAMTVEDAVAALHATPADCAHVHECCVGERPGSPTFVQWESVSDRSCSRACSCLPWPRLILSSSAVFPDQERAMH